MGFLSRLFGRSKETTGSAVDQTGDLASKGASTAGDVVEKSADVAGDAVDRAGDVAGEVADRVTGSDADDEPPRP